MAATNLHQFYIYPIPLSISGNPILLEYEVEVKLEDNVSVIQNINKKSGQTLVPAGVIILTNYRIVSIIDNKNEKIGWGFNLADVATVEDCAVNALFGRSSRIHIQLNKNAIEIGLKFESKNNEKDGFLTVLNHFLGKKSWIISRPILNPQEATVFSSSSAGVSGILRRQEQNLKSVDALAKDALTDLDSLMKRAKDVASVVQRYASYAGEKGVDIV